MVLLLLVGAALEVLSAADVETTDSVEADNLLLIKDGLSDEEVIDLIVYLPY